MLASLRLHPNYAHFGESYAWAPDHVGLHMTIRFHEKSDAETYGRIQTIGYLFSPDAGRTWQRSDGTPVTLPVTAETFERDRLRPAWTTGAPWRPERWRWPRTARRGWSTASGRLAWVPMSYAHPTGNGSWRRIVLNERVELTPGRCFGVAPSIVFEAAGRLVGVTTTEDAADEVPWGHPASEVVALRVRRRRRHPRHGGR